MKPTGISKVQLHSQVSNYKQDFFYNFLTGRNNENTKVLW